MAAVCCAAGCDRGSQIARSRLTRHLVWDASSVAGRAKVPSLSLGLIARTWPTAHGPCMYMPAWLPAKAVLPSTYFLVMGLLLKYGARLSIFWQGAVKSFSNDTDELGPRLVPARASPW